MNQEKFEAILDDCILKIKQVLGNKAKEYSSKQDWLHNFNRAKDIMRCNTREYALFGMLKKHLVSVVDMVFKHEKDGVLPTIDVLDEKIGDGINYFVLLKACFIEEIEKNKARDMESGDLEECAKIKDVVNKRKMVVEKIEKKLKPIMEFLFMDEPSKFYYTKFVDLFTLEKNKHDSVVDDIFFRNIVNLLKNLDLPADMCLFQYNFKTLEQIRKDIIKELGDKLK